MAAKVEVVDEHKRYVHGCKAVSVPNTTAALTLENAVAWTSTERVLGVVRPEDGQCVSRCVKSDCHNARART